MQRALLSWHREHGRHNLPWQKNRTAYRVWVAEIMLQQTQVQTVIPYYRRFVARFATVRDLARAPLDEVLELWAGLGYYSRARNLHRAARIVVEKHAGRLPRQRDLLEQLPGIGRSTAAAIRMQAWNLPDAILDGNVRRVMARLHAVPGWPGDAGVQRRLWALAEAASDAEHPREHCQAIMDLGATLCRRSSPDCARCPWMKHCAAHAAGNPQDYPGARPRREVPKQRLSMPLIFNQRGELLLVRRPPTGIWAQMWCLPHWPDGADYAEQCQALLGVLPQGAVRELPAVSHRLTHRLLRIRPVVIRVNAGDAVAEGSGMLWCRVDDALNRGLPRPAQRLVGACAHRPKTDR